MDTWIWIGSIAALAVLLAIVRSLSQSRRHRRQLAKEHEESEVRRKQAAAEAEKQAAARWRARPCGGGDGPPVTD